MYGKRSSQAFCGILNVNKLTKSECFSTKCLSQAWFRKLNGISEVKQDINIALRKKQVRKAVNP